MKGQNEMVLAVPAVKGKTWEDVKAGAKVIVWYLNDGTNNWARTVLFPAE